MRLPKTKPNVLTEAEKATLRQVVTRVEEAKTILLRNRILLRLLGRAIARNEECYFRVGIGCHHCLYAKFERPNPLKFTYNCGECIWQIPFSHEWNGGKRQTKDFACTIATFGGVPLSQVDHIVEYSDRMCEICYRPDDAEKDKQNACTFLLGHIQWAMEVIEEAERFAQEHPELVN